MTEAKDRIVDRSELVEVLRATANRIKALGEKAGATKVMRDHAASVFVAFTSLADRLEHGEC